jgi:hypothetical protein
MSVPSNAMKGIRHRPARFRSTSPPKADKQPTQTCVLELSPTLLARADDVIE